MSKQINTKCEKCYFSENEEKTQIGCRMGVDTVIEALNPIYKDTTIDKSDDHWTINNFYCPYARTDDWAKLIEGDLAKEVIKESNMDTGLYIYFNKDNLSNLTQTAESINQCVSQPKCVYFITNRIDPKEISDYIKVLENKSLTFKWKILNTIIDGNPTDCINMILQTNDRHQVFILKNNQSTYSNIHEEIETCEQILKMTLNKKIIITKNMQIKESDIFETLCIPVSLWHVSNKSIYACMDTIRRDLENVEDFYNIELTNV